MIRKLIFLIAFAPSFLLAQNVIWSENFDGGTLPDEWITITNDNNIVHPSVSDLSEAWTVIEDPSNEDNFVVASTSYFQPVNRANRWLITPSILLGETGNVVSWFARSQDPSFPDSYRVMVSTSDEGTIESFTDTLGVFSNEDPVGLRRTFSLKDYNNQTIKLAFINTTFNGFILYLDSLEIRDEDPLNTVSVKKESLKIYPNPAVDVLTIEIDNFQDVQLTSIEGKQLVFATNHKIDVSDFPKGVYIATVRTTTGNTIQRKIIKH